MRKERLELSRVSPLDSKSSASASSATFARAVRRTSRMRPHLSAVRRGKQHYSRCGPAAPRAAATRDHARIGLVTN